MPHFKGRSYAFLEPKSKSGVRTIILGKQALELLKNHQAEQELIKKSAGEDWTDLNLVFPSGVGTPVTASNIRRAFRKLLAVSKLQKIRFHDLRHTAASLMLNHGIPVLIVSKRLGHSNLSMTLDVYGHLIPGQHKRVFNVGSSDIRVTMTIPPKLHPAPQWCNENVTQHKLKDSAVDCTHWHSF